MKLVEDLADTETYISQVLVENRTTLFKLPEAPLQTNVAPYLLNMQYFYIYLKGDKIISVVFTALFFAATNYKFSCYISII